MSRRRARPLPSPGAPASACAPARRPSALDRLARARGSRTVVAPTNDATFGDTPRRSRYSRYSPSVVQSIVVFESPCSLEVLLLHGVVQRSHRPAFAEHLERDALPDVALAAAVDDQRLVGPAQHVDEAGRDGHAGGVDLESSAGTTDVADCDDAVVLDRDVADERRAARAVVDRAAADHDVVAWSLPYGGTANLPSAGNRCDGQDAGERVREESCLHHAALGVCQLHVKVMVRPRTARRLALQTPRKRSTSDSFMTLAPR